MENVVATYDYYTLEQAKKILEAQRKRKIKRVKKAIAKEIAWIFGVSLFTIIPIFMCVIYYLMFGY